MTESETLTALAGFAARVEQAPEYPTLYVGTRMFADVLRGSLHGVVGIVVYVDVEGKPQTSPMTVAHNPAGFLPYFENDWWSLTGWTASGIAKQDFKPTGWADKLLDVRDGVEALASTRCSQATTGSAHPVS